MYVGRPVLEKFMTKLSDALPSLLRFAIDPAIHATNNATGRALRELVVHRKVRGSIRSGKTTDRLANPCTRVTTWKTRDIDYAAQVARCVRVERWPRARKQSKEKTPGNQPVISCFMRADYLSRPILREKRVRMT